MKHPPIFYAVAQVMFNPVLTMESFIGKIQDEWRKAYPDFSHGFVNLLHVQLPPEGGPPMLKSTSTPRWHFRDTLGTSGFLLTNETLAFHTTAYSNSRSFLESLVSGLDDVHKVVSLSYIEGVGCRTLDAVIPKDGKPLSFYLNPKLMGLYGEIDGDIQQSIYQLMLKREYGQLLTRTIMLLGQVGIPADLAPIQLQFSEQINGLDGLHAILDNDVTQRVRFTYDSAEAGRRLRIVKDGLNDAFYKSLTAEALAEWD